MARRVKKMLEEIAREEALAEEAEKEKRRKWSAKMIARRERRQKFYPARCKRRW